MNAVTVNDAQRLFVLPCGSGFSCLGFDVVFKRLAQYASKLRRPAPLEADIGTLKQYGQYLEAEDCYVKTFPGITTFEPGTPVKVQALLEAYRQHRGQARIFLGDPATGVDWLDEYEVIGRIGRSMGPLHVPLLVPARAHGGCAISTANVLRIVDAESKLEVYRHPLYQQPVFDLKPSDDPAYAVSAHVKGQVHARFKSEKSAQNWVDFMHGKRMKKN